MVKKRIIVIQALFVLAVTSLAYQPALKNGFVNWDDEEYLLKNQTVFSLSCANIKKIFTSADQRNYHPLSLLSYAIEYKFFGLNPAPYHITNLLLHLLNTLLVFCFLFMLCGDNLIAAAAALLFGIHPLHVESVAWISERRDLLYSFFLLGSLLCYLAYFKKAAKKYYYAAIPLFLLSLLSKAMAVTGPFLLLLVDYLLQGKIYLRNLKEKIPFFTLSILFAAITFYIRIQSKDTSAAKLLDLNLFVVNLSSLIVFYLFKTVAPFRLSCLYPDFSGPMGAGRLLYSWGLLFLLSFAAGFLLKKTRKVFFAVLFFAVSLFPVALYSQSALSAVFDRYFYFSSIGIFYLAGESVSFLFRRFKLIFLCKEAVAILCLIIILFFFMITWKRTQVWKDGLALWNNVIKNYPHLATAYLNRGAFYLKGKEYSKAYIDFQIALQIEPDCSEAYVDLACVSNSTGRYQEAEKFSLDAIAIDPFFMKAYYSLAEAYLGLRRQGEAIDCLEKAIEKDPRYLDAYLKLGEIFGKKGEHREVIEICSRAVRHNPFSAEAYCMLSSAYGNLGDYQQAIRFAYQSRERNPRFAFAYKNLSDGYFHLKDDALAQRFLSEANRYGYPLCPNLQGRCGDAQKQAIQ